MNDLHAELHDLTERAFWISYALAKQVPSVHGRIEIATAYGDIAFEDEDAQRISRLLETLLERQLKRLNRRMAALRAQIERQAHSTR